MRKVAESLLSSEKHTVNEKVILIQQMVIKLQQNQIYKTDFLLQCFSFIKSMDEKESESKFIFAEALINHLKSNNLVSTEDFFDTVSSIKDLSIWVMYADALIFCSQSTTNSAKIIAVIKNHFAKKIGKDSSFWLCETLNNYLEYKNRQSLRNQNAKAFPISKEALDVNYSLLIRRIKLIHDFFVNKPHFIPINIDLREIMMKWILIINVDSSAESKAIVESLCDSLISVCRNEINNLNIAFKLSLNYLRFTYLPSEPLQPLFSLHLLFEKISQFQLEELLQYAILGQNWDKNEWFLVLKNLIKMGMTQNTSVVFLSFSRYLVSAKEYDVLMRVHESIIPKILTNLIYDQFAKPTLEVLEYYLVGSPKNSDILIRIKEGLLSHLTLLCQEFRFLEANQLYFIIYCLLKKHECDELLIVDLRLRINDIESKFKLTPIDDINVKLAIEEKNWLIETNYFKFFGKKASNNKNASGFRGLSNLGNTCYMNSFMQALYMNKEFRERVLKMKFDLKMEDEKMTIEPYNNKPQDFKSILKFIEPGVRLQKLFTLLYQSTRPYIKPSFFREIIPEIFRLNFQQHDSSEFGRFFLDSLERAIKFSSDKELLNNCFIGEIVNTIECQVCTNTQFKSEKYLDLHLNFPKNLVDDQLSVNNLMRLNFQNEELKDKNEYFCERCGKNSPLSLKIAKISKVPNTLIVTINRFAYDLQIQKKKKLMDFVKIDRVLNFDECTIGLPECDQYHLSSIVIHRGSTTEFGHYFCFARENLKEGSNWLILDDNNVITVKEEYINNVIEKSSDDTPYILFYQNKLVHDELLAKDTVLKLDQSLLKLVENDNMEYMKEVQNNMNAMKSLNNFNFSKNNYGGPNFYKKDDEDDSNNGFGTTMGSNNPIF